jgi:hypothetical protein
MSGRKLKKCCCLRRRTDGPGDCDPSKFPTTVQINGNFSCTCRNGQYFQDVYTTPLLSCRASAPAQAGAYECFNTTSVTVVNHAFTPLRPTFPTQYKMWAEIGSCGSGGFEVYDNPSVWPYGLRIRATFKNLFRKCGECGLNGFNTGLSWLGGFCNAPVFVGNSCCNEEVGVIGCRCGCRDQTLCPDPPFPGDCDPCLAYDLNNAWLTVS